MLAVMTAFAAMSAAHVLPGRTAILIRARSTAAMRLSPGDDPYALLEVPRSASSKELRAAFRRKARATHPDVTSAPGAVQQFQKIAAAYEVLSDDQDRASYDHRSGSDASHAAWERAQQAARQSRQEASKRSWIQQLADERWTSLGLTAGFIGGQWLTWWAFLYGVSHVSAV